MSIEITPKVGFDSVDYTKDTDTHLMLELTGHDTGLSRAPLDVIDLVDVSSSMGTARKLEHVKKSLILKISHLGAEDYLTIISYGSFAQLVLPRTKMDPAGKQKAQQSVANLRHGGGTDYGQALGALKQELSSNPNTAGYVRRIIMFSDGCPTCGEQDPHNLVKICEGTPDGWQITTMGYGLQQDELMNLPSGQGSSAGPGNLRINGNYVNQRNFSNRPDGMSGEVDVGLLTAMADAGRGNFYYMKDADSASSAFANELGGLLSTVAQNIKVEVTAEKDRITIKEVLEDVDVDDKGDTLVITLPDIMSGETKYITMPITCLKRSTHDTVRPARIANVKVTYLRPSTATTDKMEVIPRVQWVESGKETKTVNPDVQTQVAVIEAMKAQDQADQYASQGKYDLAVNAVNTAYKNLMDVGTERAMFMAGPMGPQGACGAQGYQGEASYTSSLNITQTSRRELKKGRSSGGAWGKTKGFTNQVQCSMDASFKDDWDNVDVADQNDPNQGSINIGVSQPLTSGYVSTNLGVVDVDPPVASMSGSATTSRSKTTKVSRY